MPGSAQYIPVAVGQREQGPHHLDVLGSEHHLPLVGACRQGGCGQGCAYRYHLVEQHGNDYDSLETQSFHS